MLIAHVSDSHSRLVPIPEQAEIIVHSGDFLPNSMRDFYDDSAKISIEQNFQRKWVEKSIDALKEWIGPRKFIFSSGNHDFCDPTRIMREAGIDAINIDGRVVEYEGLTLYGFPFIPWIGGEWNFECEPETMRRRIRMLDDVLKENTIDILVAHCPPYGIQDCRIVTRLIDDSIGFTDQKCGNIQLTDLLMYMEEKHLPRYVFSGHLHPHYGITSEMGITFSNAATTINLIEVEKK